MAGDIIPFEVPANLTSEMADLFGDTSKDLTEGVSDSFAVVSFKGKVWRVKFRGEEKIVKDPKTGDPMPSLVAVIVKGSPQISKIYYPGAYTEGDSGAPDCFSLDGVRPDPSAVSIQAQTCAACPKNVWGSKITEQGNKTKACADSRRMAVVPYPDIRNEAFGGPLLLRVPPASLQELKTYSEGLKTVGLPAQAVVTKISFDHELAYPKLTFTALKALSLEEATTVRELMDSDVLNRMLAEAPITDDAVTPSQATQAGPGAAESAPLDTPSAPVEPATAAPTTESVATAEPVVSAESTSASTAPVEKPTPKEANAVEGIEVNQELDGLIGSLL